MIVAELPTLKIPIFISEIFPLTISQPNVLCFRLTPGVNENAKSLGNRLSFHLSRKFPDIAVTWHQGDFVVLAKPEQPIPEPAEWREALESIRVEVKDLSVALGEFSGFGILL